MRAEFNLPWWRSYIGYLAEVPVGDITVWGTVAGDVEQVIKIGAEPNHMLAINMEVLEE